VTFVRAPTLRAGDLVCVVAPSGPVTAEDLWPGLAWLRSRYEVQVSPGVLARDGFLAGADERRRDELRRAMSATDVRAIVVARGGYGAIRILSSLPWRDLRERPKWLVGFSDVTALHAMAWSHAIASVHGPNVTGLGVRASPAIRASWLAALERPQDPVSWRGLTVVRSGTGSGPIVGGNLSLLHAMAAAGRLGLPDRAVLVMEDVNEAPYRVDRMLTSLLLGGHLERVSALVFGGFDRAPIGPDGQSVNDVIARFARSIDAPVLAGAPFGHGVQNESFVLGARARVRGDTVEISCAEGEGERSV
jgi:muramoyltetrapeptide carboxypeptidase